MITKTLEEQAQDQIDTQNWITANKAKPKKTDLFLNGKIVETTEISDDGRIVVTKTNPNGL